MTRHADAVTAVVPTHGRPLRLAVALASIQAQTCPVAEILIVDDLGDEATDEVVRRSGQEGPSPVRRLLNMAGTGASSSRNLGAGQAMTPLVAFLDDDDCWRPQFVERARTALVEAGADMALVGLHRFRVDGTEQLLAPPPAVSPDALLDRNASLTGSNLLLTRDAFDAVDGFDPALPVFNDWDFFLRFVRAGLRYTVVSTMLAEWREHDEDRLSTVSTRRAAGVEAFLAKHRPWMTAQQARDIAALATGLRRRTATSRTAKAYHAVRLAGTLGPREGARRLWAASRTERSAPVPVILFPHSRDALGGSVVTGGLLSQALSAEEGWDVTAATNGAGVVADYHRRLDVKVVELDAAGGRTHVPRPAQGNRIQRAMKRARIIVDAERYLRTHRVDLVHVNDESSALGWGLASRWRGIPMVWQVHQQERQTIDWLLLRLSSHVVFVADSNRVRFGHRRPASSSTIHNGVDPSVFCPADLPLRSRPAVRIAFVNSLVDRKRPEWVVRAGAELVERGHDIEIVLAGDDHTGAAERLSASAAGQVLGRRLSVLGHVDDVARLLREADILALPSMRDKEAFPRIIVEALASGVPVVATAVAGIPEAVTHGECGLLVDPDDLSGFVDALEQLVLDPELRRQMGKNGREKALREFSLSQGLARHQETYAWLLSGSRGSTAP